MIVMKRLLTRFLSALSSVVRRARVAAAAAVAINANFDAHRRCRLSTFVNRSRLRTLLLLVAFERRRA